MTMPFGKYKGLEIQDIIKYNPSYIVWLFENVDLKNELFDIVKDSYHDCFSRVEKIKQANINFYTKPKIKCGHQGEHYKWCTDCLLYTSGVYDK